MPALPWMKWFPQDWISDPGLAMCDAATRGIWADAVNIMLLSGKPYIEGTDEQLSRALRCRTTQIQVAVGELKQFEVCIVTMQNACTRLACRRLLRQQKTKAGKQKAANARWKPECKPDANGYAPSASASAYAYASDSVPEEGGVGEGIFKPTFEQACDWLAGALKNGADYTKGECHSAWLALDAGGWMWGRNSVKDWRSAIERQIQSDRGKKNYGTNAQTNRSSNVQPAKPDHSKGF